VLVDQFGHGEHVDLVLAKDFLHSIVAADVALVFGVLKIVAFDVLPQLLCDLGS
jgi:hypothetical protein